MLMTLTDLSQFFRENKFISTNFVPMSPPNTPRNIQNDEFRGYQKGTLAAKKVKEIYYLILDSAMFINRHT